MMEYTAKDTLRIAKRQQNAKRTYLLVNPLQAKHMPVSPTASLNMMRTLGRKLANKYPEAKLVIGFAETATAIGAAVAGCFGSRCVYIHTTREKLSNVDKWLCFSEEHSHAVEQKICGDRMNEWLLTTPQIIFVDDELSTGKTLTNMVLQLRSQFQSLASTNMIAASLMNRLTPDCDERLTDANMTSEYLVKLPDEDYTELVAGITASPAEVVLASQKATHPYTVLRPSENMLNPRLGVYIGEYEENCRHIATGVITAIKEQLSNDDSILVLGTEECMYPALILGQEIERSGLSGSVYCHATTRSPIGVWRGNDSYPITEGYRVHSFYDDDRETYIYNLKHYDKVIVISDTEVDERAAMEDICAALAVHGHSKVYFVGGRHV